MRVCNWLLSLRGQTDPTALLARLRGEDRYILDYLTDEVLQQQPTAIRHFLHATSILERLCSPLCDALMGQAGSQQVLEYLERANLFVVSLDSERRWYRYHALFAEALRYRLEQLDGQSISLLHLRASNWYAQQGYLNEAIHHALLAQAWQWAADLIESSAGPGTSLFTRGESWTIRHWLQQLPEETARARPRLCLAYARSLRLAAQLRAAEPWLQAAEAALLASSSSPSSHVDPLSGTQWSAFKSFVGYPTQVPESTENDSTVFHKEHERGRMLGEILALRALIAGNYGESEATFNLCQQAMIHLSEQVHYEHTLVSLARGLAFNAVGQAKAATQSALESSASYQAAGMIASAISYMGLATLFLHMQGQLHAVWRICQRAIQSGTEAGSSANAAVGLIYARQADILREWNQLDVALEHWGNAVEQANVAAHNMVCAPTDRRPHVAVPAFWSSQFGVNIKSVGVPSAAEEVVITQGELAEASFVAAYGKEGQLVAAVAFNHAKWVEFYQRLIEQAAPFPPEIPGAFQPTPSSPVPAAFPDPRVPTHEATVVLTGHDPNERRVQWIARHRAP